MRHYANSLDEIYELLESFQEPLAVIDFISGEMGYETLTAQVLGGMFYDTHKDKARVVALAWAGQSMIFNKVSDDQIELSDIGRSMSGNKKHQAANRLAWLERSGHSLKNIPDVIAHLFPMAPSEKMLIGKYGINQEQLLRRAASRLRATQDMFMPEGDQLVSESYIAIFDRNDKHQSERNTKEWQVRRLCDIAGTYGLKVVVVSGFNPRNFGDGIIHFAPRHRDLDLLCNIVHHSVFFAGPVSGATSTGAVFGCDLLTLGQWWGREPLIGDLVVSRGFSYLGHLHTDNIRRFLDART